MKKFVLIPDSFKGTLSSKRICEIMESQIKEIFPNASVIKIPVADGGEGSVDCFLSAMSGERVELSASGPFFDTVDGFYGLIDGGKTAIIEMAAVAGLPLVENNKNPLKTTTYGVGELIKHALDRGVKKIIVGLGGSCTNDFGCGTACALGVKFLDKENKNFIPTGGTLSNIVKIDLSGLDKRVNNVEFEVMCDIDNPPFGRFGTSRVFAPQKGADEKTVEILDDGVKHLCGLIKNTLGVDLSTLKGGGAAGAMGAGMVAFFNAKLKMGINTVLDTVNFDQVLQDADVVFTGEGKIDGQSLRGKVVIGVARRAKEKSVPVIAVVGGVDGDMQEAYEQGVTAVFSINRLPEDFSVSRFKSEQNLKATFLDILRALKM